MSESYREEQDVFVDVIHSAQGHRSTPAQVVNSRAALHRTAPCAHCATYRPPSSDAAALRDKNMAAPCSRSCDIESFLSK
ncbi:hypothetical protein INR49_008569 [Caranx melampygus]|nr:hypothetical protein INR49_008569 [Caranx melampygus]